LDWSGNIRVKICCIGSKIEALTAINYGVSALGLVSEMPSGPGVISENLIKGIVKVIPPGISSVLLTSKQDVKSITLQQKKTKVNTIQIVDKILQGSYIDLKENLPGISLIQVIHVIDYTSIDEALKVAPYVNAILLDSGTPDAAIKKLGGTGEIHNWEISKKIRELLDIPVFLAGRLNSSNVLSAINLVKPFGVDVCTGVRSNGKLDISKLSAFMKQVSEYNKLISDKDQGKEKESF